MPSDAMVVKFQLIRIVWFQPDVEPGIGVLRIFTDGSKTDEKWSRVVDVKRNGCVML